MSKIRNSLGIVVLPIPHDTLSIQSYKDTYSIDLNEIFAVKSGATRFKKGFSKLIALDASKFFPDGNVIPLSLVNMTFMSGTKMILPLSIEHRDNGIVASSGLAIDIDNDDVGYYEL